MHEPPVRKQADFHLVFRDEKIGQSEKGTKQMAATTPAQTGTDAAAVSRGEEEWDCSNCNAAQTNGRRLQMRIVQATKEGRGGKGKVLHPLLTHSFSGKALGVNRVRENQGQKTSGVERESWTMPSQKAKAIRRLQPRGARPKRLRGVSLPKSSGKLRPLGIPGRLDRAMQALYLLAVDPISEPLGDPNSSGFRKDRATADAIEQACAALSRKNCAPWILQGDIKACVDRISQDWLWTPNPMEKVMLQKGLKAGFIDKEVLPATEEGPPQGGSGSPGLANMTLDGREKKRGDHFPKPDRASRKEKVKFIRCADDLLIPGRSKAVLAREVKALVEHCRRERGLEVAPEKPRITHMEDGFDVLGQHLRKYNGKRHLTPARKHVQTF